LISVTLIPPGVGKIVIFGAGLGLTPTPPLTIFRCILAKLRLISTALFLPGSFLVIVLSHLIGHVCVKGIYLKTFRCPQIYCYLHNIVMMTTRKIRMIKARMIITSIINRICSVESSHLTLGSMPWKNQYFDILKKYLTFAWKVLINYLFHSKFLIHAHLRSSIVTIFSDLQSTSFQPISTWAINFHHKSRYQLSTVNRRYMRYRLIKQAESASRDPENLRSFVFFNRSQVLPPQREEED